jgi:tetratricopeptide (TPR) repeat protein
MNPSLRTLTTLVLLTAAAVAAVAQETSGPALEGTVRAALARLEQQTVDPLLLDDLRPTEPEAELVDRRRTAIARSVLTMQAQVDTTLAVLEGDVLTMLSLARNHRHLGLRKRAMRLYELTVLADRKHEYTREILQERLACAIELGDSVAVLTQTTEIVERKDAATYGAALASGVEYLVATPRIGLPVRRLLDSVQSVSGLDHPSCLIRLAQARQVLGEHERAHGLYRNLLLRMRDLDAHQTAIALMGLADTAFAMGDTARATSLYRSYRARNAGRLSAWSTYQLGNMAASSGDLERAVSLLRSICEREDHTPWKESACVRLAQVRQLQGIEAELRPFGRTLGGSGKTR